MNRKTLSLLVLLFLFVGCHGRPELREDWSSDDEVFQLIANSLPDISLGVAEAPAVISFTRTTKLPPKTPAKDLVLRCNETAFFIRTNTLVPRRFEIPYDAIVAIDYGYKYFPNLMYCVTIPFIQAWECRLILDADKVKTLTKTLTSDIKTLREISKEIGVPAPFYYAEELERRLRSVEAEWGQGRIELVLSRTSPVPPYFPYSGKIKPIAEAFEWARTPVEDEPKDSPKDSK